MNTPLDVIIEGVYISDKSKDGKPFIDKRGNPYKKVAIKTNVHGDKWLSALSFKDTDPIRDLVKGQGAKIVVEESGQYLNFSLPTKYDMLEYRVSELEKAVFNKAQEEKEVAFEDDLESDLPF